MGNPGGGVEWHVGRPGGGAIDRLKVGLEGGALRLRELRGGDLRDDGRSEPTAGQGRGERDGDGSDGDHDEPAWRADHGITQRLRCGDRGVPAQGRIVRGDEYRGARWKPITARPEW